MVFIQRRFLSIQHDSEISVATMTAQVVTPITKVGLVRIA